jgi:glycosyltransferase involved in cell wall biosynthesis
MNNYTISVVIPAFNVAPYLGKAIECVLAQDELPFEIIVVDDGSTDETGTVAKSYPMVKYIFQKNRGASWARNVGVNLASGDWVAFLDADDIWLPHHLRGTVDIIFKYKLVWAFGSFKSTAKTTGEGVGRDHLWLPLLKAGVYFEDFFLAWANEAPFCMDGLIVKRSVLQKVGAFDPELPIGEELDLYFRIARQYPQVGLLRPPSAIYQYRPSSLVQSYSSEVPKTFLILLQRYIAFAVSKASGRKGLYDPVVKKLTRLILDSCVTTRDIGTLIAVMHLFGTYRGRDKLVQSISLYIYTISWAWNAVGRLIKKYSFRELNKSLISNQLSSSGD